MERTGSNSAGTAAGRRQSVSPEQEGASGTERSLPQTPTPRMPFLSIKIAKENTAVSGKRFHRRCPLTTWRVRRSTTRSDRRAVTAGGARVQQVDGWARPRKGYNLGGARTARLSRALHRISPHTEPIARQRCACSSTSVLNRATGRTSTTRGSWSGPTSATVPCSSQAKRLCSSPEFGVPADPAHDPIRRPPRPPWCGGDGGHRQSRQQYVGFVVWARSVSASMSDPSKYRGTS